MSRASTALITVIAALCLTVPVTTQSFVLSGTITDSAGNPEENAEIFAYDSPTIRRPADFISARTGRDGRYLLDLPQQTYWVVARVRKGDKFGPLMPGDRHSGEPVEVEPGSEHEVRKDFTVADIREAAQSRRKTRDDYVRLSGRILTKKGSAVTEAYVFAQPRAGGTGIPPFISPGSDEKGEYTLLLPAGTYRVGAAVKFPPETKETVEVTVAAGKEMRADVRLPGDPLLDAEGHPDEAQDE